MKIEKVCVVGLGRLGGCLAVAMALRGIRVVGADKDPVVITALAGALEGGDWHRSEPTREQMSDAQPCLTLTTDLGAAIHSTDMAVVLVPTPTDAMGGFSLDCVLDAVRGIGEALQDRADRPYTVAVGSTVMPGSMRTPVRQALEEVMGRGLDSHVCPVTLAYVPEFVALGDCVRGFQEPEFVVIGCDGKPDDIVDLYQRFLWDPDIPILPMTLEEAEITKLALNWCVALKTIEANLIGALCERFPGANGRVVTRAVGLDPRIGDRYFKPGLPVGGPCFARDLKAMRVLATLAKTGNFLPAAAEMFNDWHASRLETLVERKLKRFGPDGKLGILGLAFKDGTDCTTGSMGWKLLEKFGKQAVAYDPLVTVGQSCTDAQTVAGRADVVFVSWRVPGLEMVRWRKYQVIIDPWGMVDKVAVAEAEAILVLPGVGQEG
jgi:UDPglucose 6-dehydrogenase